MKKYCVFLFLLIIMGLVGCNAPEYVNFYNYDGTLLWQTEYQEGMYLTYDGETPTKLEDDIYQYTFVGWNHNLEEVDTYKNFFAIYEAEYKTFKVSFYDYDNSYIYSTDVRYGEGVSELPANPIRENDQKVHYYFAGWGDVDLAYITEDVKCVAEYTEVPCYEIQYRDSDNKLLKTEYIEKGGSSSYTINTVKEASDTEYYVFSNWSHEVKDVTGDMIVYAEYDTIEACTVTFKNYDGTVLSTVKGPKGFTAVYNGYTPTKPSETSGYYKYSYSFSGWDISLSNITSNVTATAKFSSSSKYYNPTYLNALSEIRSNATSYDTDTGRYYRGFGLNGSASGIVTGYAEYDSSTMVVDLYYAVVSYSGGSYGGGMVTIFFDLDEPGTYYCTYKYSYNGSTAATGMFNISSYWSSSSSVNFTSFYSSSGSEYQHASLAAQLVSQCLSSAASTSWIDTNALGFYYY